MLVVLVGGMNQGLADQEPRTVMVEVQANSQAMRYEAYRAMDGDPATMWHTDFQGDNPVHPHELQIDLSEQTLDHQRETQRVPESPKHKRR